MGLRDLEPAPSRLDGFEGERRVTQDRDQLDACQLLLAEAGRLHERYEAGRPEPFNVFSVLRKETDEVHLHSRFLKALLDYRRSPDGPRENLRDFLGHLDTSQGGNCLQHLDLDPGRSRVDREFENIDILIRDQTTMHAVVIENKIWAQDQPEQLKSYKEQLETEGYTPHLLYLTLDGHDPSTGSGGGLEYHCISYKDIRPWLTRCQERAYDKPALRESIAQYLDLVSRLTGTDHSEEYMKELKELCLKDDNLVVVHDLNEAMVEARIALLSKLWKEIDSGISKNICDFPEESKDKEESDITEDRIRQFVIYQRNYAYHGLFWKLDDRGHDRWLAIQVQRDPIRFGVCFDREQNQDEWNKLREALDGDGGRNEQWWPWFRDPQTDLNLKNPTRQDLRRLASDERRREYVEEVVTDVQRLWERIKEAGLT